MSTEILTKNSLGRKYGTTINLDVTMTDLKTIKQKDSWLRLGNNYIISDAVLTILKKNNVFQKTNYAASATLEVFTVKELGLSSEHTILEIISAGWKLGLDPIPHKIILSCAQQVHGVCSDLPRNLRIAMNPFIGRAHKEEGSHVIFNTTNQMISGINSKKFEGKDAFLFIRSLEPIIL